MKTFAQKFLRLTELLCIALLALIAFVIALQIFCRTFSIGISWTEELARLAFCLLSFIGAPLALAESSHIAVDMVVDHLPRRPRAVAEAFISIAVGTFSVFGIRSALSNLTSYRGVTAVSMTWLKMNWIYTAILLSFAALLAVSAVRLVCVFRGKPLTLHIHDGEEPEEEELDLDI